MFRNRYVHGAPERSISRKPVDDFLTLHRNNTQKPGDDFIKDFQKTFSDIMPMHSQRNASVKQEPAELVDRTRYIPRIIQLPEIQHQNNSDREITGQT